MIDSLIAFWKGPATSRANALTDSVRSVWAMAFTWAENTDGKGKRKKKRKNFSMGRRKRHLSPANGIFSFSLDACGGGRIEWSWLKGEWAEGKYKQTLVYMPIHICMHPHVDPMMIGVRPSLSPQKKKKKTGPFYFHLFFFFLFGHRRLLESSSIDGVADWWPESTQKIARDAQVACLWRRCAAEVGGIHWWFIKT